MVQLSLPSVASMKNPTIAKAKTPEERKAVDMPVKAEAKTPKQTEKKPTKAALLSLIVKKEAKSTHETPNETEAAPLRTPKIKKGSLNKKARSTPRAAAALGTSKIKKVTLKKAKNSSKAATALQTDKSPKIQTKNVMKKAIGIPKEAAPQSLKNGTVSAKRAKKVKTLKQKPAEDINMASEGEEEATPAAGTASVKRAKKLKICKQKPAEEVDMALEGVEEAVSASLTAFAERAKKVKTRKQKPAEDVDMALEGEEEAVPASETASAKRAKKVKTRKRKPAEDVDMALEGEEEAVPASVTASAMRAKKVKTRKRKPAEDVDMALEGEEEAVPASETASAKRAKKVKTRKQKPAEDVEIASGEEEVAASPVKAQNLPKKNSVNSTSAIYADPKQERNHNKNGKFCLFLNGLNYNTDQDAVMKHFAQFGTVTRCYLPCNPEKAHLNKGFGFIDFDSQPAMDGALAKTHTLDGRTLQLKNNTKGPETVKRKHEESVVPSGGEKKHRGSSFEHELFVGRLSFCTSRDTIRDHFSQFGEVINVTLPMENATQNKGFAFVAFEDASSLQKALEDTNQVIDAVKINPTQKRQKSVGKEEAVYKSFCPNELFVGGLDPTTLKETLEQHFSRYGKVSTVTLPSSKPLGRKKSYAFVAFESTASLEYAFGEDHEIDGMRLDIRPA